MIYFMQAVDGGAVKIGTTEDLPTRHKQLEAHYGKRLAILRTIPGGCDLEKRIHRSFEHLRFGRTEQFRPAPDLMEFIGRPLLVGANPEAVEAMDPGKFVPLDRAIAAKAQMIATDRGVTLADYVSDSLRTLVEKDWAKMVRRVGGEGKP